MVLLGIRPLARQHHLGRETLLTPVTWDADGWPVINQGEPLTKVMHSAGLPASVVWPIEAHREKFRASKLALHWSTLRGPATELMSLRERPGMLRLKGNTVTLNDVGTPAFVARRQEHMQLHAATQLDFTPRDEGQSAGLALRQNEANYVTVRVIGVRHRRVELVQRRQGISTIAASFPIKRGAVILQIDAFQDHYQFSVQQGLGKVHILGSTPTSDLSSETAGGFTGVFLGMVASTESKTLMPPADFSWFDYQAGEE